MTVVRTVALAAVSALALAGCSTPEKAVVPKAAAPSAIVTEPPPADPPAGTSVTRVPGAKKLKVSTSLRKKVTYPDAVSVSITDVKRVKVTDQGRGSIKGQELAIFTVKFDNGSAKPLDLNKTLVTALYGKRKTAKPTYYADLNDFYGEVAPKGTRSAAYAFAIPVTEYKKVALQIKFGTGYKLAEWIGSLEP
jgi:hypothetical protein